MDLLICDLRPKWRGKPYITFWRANNSGYAYPLSWAGNYTDVEVIAGGKYYTVKTGHSLTRFAVPREVAEAMAVPPSPGRIDGDAGPVVPNTAEARAKLRRAAFRIPEGE